MFLTTEIFGAVLALGSGNALAGGLGVVATAGLHEGRAYYYRIQDGEQGVDVQRRPNAGFGIEGLLGDRDDKVLGLIRVYMLSDSPLKEPDLSGESGSEADYEFPPAHEEGAYVHGVGSFGIQWGVVGDPTGTQFILTTLLGSGFWTTDNLEYIVAEVGPGFSYHLTETLQLNGNLAYTLRYRKRASHGGNAYLGIRYMFD